VTERPKQKRQGAWVEKTTFREANTGLSVVVSERIRGRPAYSIQILHLEEQGGNKHIQLPVRGLDKVPYEGDEKPQIEDVVKALVKIARDWCDEHPLTEPKKDKPRRDGKKGGGDKRKREAKGGLSALARKDAEAKGHEYKGPSQKRKEKRKQATS